MCAATASAAASSSAWGYNHTRAAAVVMADLHRSPVASPIMPPQHSWRVPQCLQGGGAASGRGRVNKGPCATASSGTGRGRGMCRDAAACCPPGCRGAACRRLARQLPPRPRVRCWCLLWAPGSPRHAMLLSALALCASCCNPAAGCAAPCFQPCASLAIQPSALAEAAAAAAAAARPPSPMHHHTTRLPAATAAWLPRAATAPCHPGARRGGGRLKGGRGTHPPGSRS